ncbi:acyltransferase domain-containing protein [Salinactinospora qingdaonensis]|uniref:Acyltransferase domain-containing protein n=1 Tax=Salinactinospora qingdaonensis TaxID=702744 RepID=A0ABP7GGK6_9ACTN
MDIATLRQELGLGPEHASWLHELDRLTPAPAPLPPRDRAPHVLDWFALTGHDAEELVELWPDAAWPATARWLLERMYARIQADLGSPHWWDCPAPMAAADARLRCAPVYAFAAALPMLRAYHARHGVPVEVTAATLADVGRHVAKTRRMYGRVGLELPTWVALHYRGGLYELGRLQYEPSVVGPGETTPPGAPEPGTPVLRLHIPQAGPLDPAAVTASLRRARPFFAAHFGVDYRIASCSSWLLDGQLAHYLPEDANIVDFQRRFTGAAAWAEDGDADVFRFIFDRPEVDLAALASVPQHSRLHRAVVEHLRWGGHWRRCYGWLELP